MRKMVTHPGALARMIAVCATLSLALIATAAETTYQYDDLGRVVSATYANGEKVEFSYDSAGNRASVTTSGVPGPVVAVGNASVSEGGSLSFTVNRSGNTAQAFSVNYATANGTSSAGIDYTSKSGTLTFSSGQTSQTVVVVTLEDDIHENNETVHLNLSSATAGATISDTQGVGTITNDDAAPTFSVNNVSTTEGGNLSFTLTKSGATAKTHQINYATANGTASGSDYTAKSGTLTFTPTQTAQIVAVVSIADGIHENDETVQLNLSSATAGATIADSQGIGTITDGDAPPSFSVNNVSASEGDDLTFTVTKSGATANSHQVSFATANGTASVGSDYTSQSGTLTFAPGQTAQIVTVSTTEDGAHENNETVRLNLSSATGGATISDSQGIGTITNDDAGPAFSVNNVSVSEGGNLSFTVTKSGATANTHNVNYATANGTASSSDYTATSGTLTFTATQTSQTVVVATIEDTTHENNETARLNLSSATAGATITDSQGIGTITNDDAGPAFSVNNVSAPEGNNLTFTVTKSGATANSHQVSYATGNGTASAGADYTSNSGTLTFTSGQTSQTVVVATLEDSIFEDSKTLNLNLSSATGGASISDNQGVGTITNDDAAPAFSVNNVSTSEGNNLTFTVTKSGATAKTHNVSYATANGTASSNDYSSRSGTLSFTSTQTSKTISVPTTEDSVFESNETVRLNLSSATAGATIADSQGIGTINNDDPDGFVQTITITGSGPVNLRSLANAAGYNGAKDATITFELPSGVTIRGVAGSPNGGRGIDTGTWPTGSYDIDLTLSVSGNVYGGGGQGGRGAASSGSLAATAGGNGGDAVYSRLPMTIRVNSGGRIRAGGGGGGGGGHGVPGGMNNHGGGGGGGGFPNGQGGSGGSATNVVAGSAGGNGTLSSGGTGGDSGGSSAGDGGNGGAPGGNGRSGDDGNWSDGASGGAVGFAIRKNGHSVPVTNNGIITGAVGG